MATYVYDIEVFPNCFAIKFVNINVSGVRDYIDADINNDVDKRNKSLSLNNIKTFLIWLDGNNNINDIVLIHNFIETDEDLILISYNGYNYDNVILDYLLSLDVNLSTSFILNQIYLLNNSIINGDIFYNPRKEWKIDYNYLYKSIDVQRLNYLDKNKIGLKQVLISLKWYNIEELELPEVTDYEITNYYYNRPIPRNSFNRYLIFEHLEPMLHYLTNDCLGTLEVYNQSKEELASRIVVLEKYGINCLSNSRSSTADRILSYLYSNATGLKYWDFAGKRTYRSVVNFKDIILSEVEFETKELQDFLITLYNTSITITNDKESDEKAFQQNIIYKGKAYTMALGGLHSVDNPYDYKSDDKYTIIDVDADSYYPTGIVNHKIKAEHLDDKIIDIIDSQRLERIAYKKEGKKNLAEVNKIVLNAGVFGKLGSKNSWMNDAKAMYKVTINLQLFLFMLIEQLNKNDIEVISANTDGITCKVPNDKLDIYYQICKDWGSKLNFTYEFNKYVRYVRTNVNNYLAILEDGKTKQKGEFVTKLQMNTGYYAPAIAKTIEAYYKSNANINDTIKSFDIYDYLISIKVGGQFVTKFHIVKDNKPFVKTLQKNNRYFISTDGGRILKHSIDNDNKTINIIKGKRVTIFNKFYYSNDYHIDYNWYKAQVLDIIDKINLKHYKDAKEVTGKLFD